MMVGERKSVIVGGRGMQNRLQRVQKNFTAVLDKETLYWGNKQKKALCKDRGS